jgi:predicted PurR-regulated permease PerM
MAASDLAPRPGRFLTLACGCVVVAALYLARGVLVPLAVALLLTFLLTPLVHGIERRGLWRVPSVLIVVIFSFAILGGIGWLISSQATDLAIKLGDYQSDIERKIGNIEHFFGHGALGQATRAINKMASDVVTSQPSSNPGSEFWLTRGTTSNPMAVRIAAAPEGNFTLTTIGDALEFIAPMAQSLVVVVFVVFMLIQREDIRDRVIRLVGHGKLTVTTQALDDAATRISRYLMAQSSINGVYGLVVGTGLYLIHVPNAPLWGLLCALLRFIPYLGIWIGAAFPIILSFVVPDGYYAARPLLTIGLFAVTELIAANVAEPLLFGASTGLSPLAILVAAVFWTWLWGVVGLLLSTPLTVLLAVAGKHVPQLAFLDVLLGDQPVLEPPERYYQRLLADDPEEAEDLLEEFEHGRSLEELFASIMLPALRMAERDHRLGVLDEEKQEFIGQAMKDQVEARLRPAGVQKNAVVKVVCIPAHGRADEIASLMVAALLQEQGYSASCISSETLASERIDQVTAGEFDLAVISATPPAAITHARYVCKKLHGRLAEMPILIGLWNAANDQEKLRKRMACASEVRLETTLRDAMATVHQMVQPQVLRGPDGEHSATGADAVAKLI